MLFSRPGYFLQPTNEINISNADKKFLEEFGSYSPNFLKCFNVSL